MNKSIIVFGDEFIDIRRQYFFKKVTDDLSPVYKMFKEEKTSGGAGNIYRKLKNFLPSTKISCNTICREVKNIISLDHIIPIIFRLDEPCLKTTKVSDSNTFENMDYEFVAISDYDKDNFSDDYYQELIDVLKDKGSTVFVNTVRYRECFKNADYIQTNWSEYKKSKQFLYDYENTLIVSQGDKGLTYFPNLSKNLPSKTFKAYDVHGMEYKDTDGAGDVLFASFIAGMFMHGDPIKSLEVATKHAALSIKTHGTFTDFEYDISEEVSFYEIITSQNIN